MAELNTNVKQCYDRTSQVLGFPKVIAFCVYANMICLVLLDFRIQTQMMFMTVFNVLIRRAHWLTAQVKLNRKTN